MATKTDIELKIVDSVDTSHTEAEVLTDSAANPDAFYVGRGYLAHNGEKVIEGIDPNGSYPNMTVGNAQKAKKAEKATHADTATDLSGRVEATPEVFTYRPSAGEKSIKDDNAFIRRVKGNSVVWNQLVNGSVYSDTQTRYGLQCSVTSNSREFRVVGTYVGDTSIPDRHIYAASALTTHYTGIVGHKYLCHISGNKECSLTVHGWCSVSTDIFDSIIKECTSAQPFTIAIQLPLVADGTQIDETIIIDIHDLTQMFGAGNEPTTVEEFRELYPDSYYLYNTGKLRNLVCSGIKTVGFNQWDEQWEVGQISSATGNVVSGGNKIISKNYIPVLPNTSYFLTLPLPQDDSHGVYYYDGNKNYIGFQWIARDVNQKLFTTPSNCLFIKFDSWGTTYNNNICINLHHTGWRDGNYEPYKEVTHSLPLSQITNGEPLRKAGSVYDEINETDYIKRVGVRPYAEGDENDATLLTDGTNTNHPLAEPIVTPITTPIDFNYYVEDFGTEEALLAEDSAPFSADIVYQFNATDQIRNNTRNIDKLQKSAFTPSGTSAQYIRGDGSYGDRVELSQSTPINDGEYEMPDEGDYDMQFILTPSYYAKSPRELDDTTTIAVFVTAPEDSNHLAEYWFEFAVGESLPNIEYYQPNNSDAVFRIDGDMMTYAVNILHLISSDGGETFFGEIKNYVL